MTPEETEPGLLHEETLTLPDQPLTDRRPWVAPALERLDLRDAMAVSGTGAFDGIGSS